jgi:hypothetical protein
MPVLRPRRRTAVRVATPAFLLAALLISAGPAIAAAPAPATARSASTLPVRTTPLVDGSTARITELGFKDYELQIIYRGEVMATLEANQHDAGVDANDMFVVLTFDGEVASWIGGNTLGPGSFPLPDGSTAKITELGFKDYKLEIIYRGEVMATLEANQHDAGVDANDMFVVLTFDGSFSAWIGTPR